MGNDAGYPVAPTRSVLGPDVGPGESADPTTADLRHQLDMPTAVASSGRSVFVPRWAVALAVIVGLPALIVIWPFAAAAGAAWGLWYVLRTSSSGPAERGRGQLGLLIIGFLVLAVVGEVAWVSRIFGRQAPVAA